jgi:hypothetical protein
MEQIINKGASKAIPDSANMISTIRFDLRPIGRGKSIGAKRKSLCISTNPFIWGTPKKNLKTIPPHLPIVIKVMGSAQFLQARIMSNLPLS